MSRASLSVHLPLSNPCVIVGDTLKLWSMAVMIVDLFWSHHPIPQLSLQQLLCDAWKPRYLQVVSPPRINTCCKTWPTSRSRNNYDRHNYPRVTCACNKNVFMLMTALLASYSCLLLLFEFREPMSPPQWNKWRGTHKAPCSPQDHCFFCRQTR